MATGSRRRGRDVSGILLLDKPVGISSNAALQRVKRIYNARKAGHTGNLDVLASGLLPVCLGEATKISGFLLDANKRYRSSFRLGQVTTTGDAEGEIKETRIVESYDPGIIREVLGQFTGIIEQMPPMHSALKHHGQPLYKLARKGLTVERKLRTVTIFELELLRFDGNILEVEVECSKGTYIRTLAEDIGNFLGCGAHVDKLRRLRTGHFSIEDARELGELQAEADQGFTIIDNLLLPPDSALQTLPEITLSADMGWYVCNGQPVFVPRAPTSGLVRLYVASKNFIGIGEVLNDGRIAPRRLLSQETGKRITG